LPFLTSDSTGRDRGVHRGPQDELGSASAHADITSSLVSGRSPDSRSFFAAPSRNLGFQWFHAASSRLQWRGRAGFAPASRSENFCDATEGHGGGFPKTGNVSFRVVGCRPKSWGDTGKTRCRSSLQRVSSGKSIRENGTRGTPSRSQCPEVSSRAMLRVSVSVTKSSAFRNPPAESPASAVL